ncbi:GTPase [Egicoccus sp. AB-alg6-2]|uniref:GTPase n=1 Tax=Egicoccus sp. AB-alg6-2 TaxID=3242692 RepID=UPI00359DA60B
MRARPAAPAQLQVGDALDAVVELGDGRLEPSVVAEAGELRRRLDERLARGDGLTVAALAGGTGVGKSALTNVLLGREVAVEGARRPTTSQPLAGVSRHTDVSDALLDWLDVPERHEVGDALPDGLVLLDLPDHDSVVASHRATAVRMAARVDVVVWVVDPLKYAREDTHAGPLADLTAHAEVLLVVLNRADELPPDQLEVCRTDLRRRLEAGGHGQARLFATSARTGAGVDELRSALVELAERRRAAAARLVADAAVFGGRTLDHLDTAEVRTPDVDDVLAEVLVAVDGHRAAAEAAGLYRLETARRARSPLARALGRPFRAAASNLLRRTADGPPPRTATVEAVESAMLRAADVGRTSGHAHAAMHQAVQRAASRSAPTLTDAVARADLVPRPRRWWKVVSILRLVAELVAVVGALWLAALAVVDWLRLPELPVPHVAGELPWPTALLLGGVLARLLFGVLTRWFARVGARRHAARVRRRIEEGLRRAITEGLLAPLQDEIDAQARLRAAVQSLAEAASRP